MLINMQEGLSESNISFTNHDIAFVGEVLDRRGERAVEYIKSISNSLLQLDYDENEFTLNVDGTIINAERFDDYINSFKGKSIALETTTLGFVEIFYCCKALFDNKFPKVTLLYLEPLEYKRSSRSQIMHRHDFDLSEEFAGFRAIPGATIMLSDRYSQRGVFLLGFEERRLDRALEDYQMIQTSKSAVVFGVPAFKAGWEMNSFANNIRVIRDKKLRGGVHFCGANNPLSTLELLNKCYNTLNTDERMFISPIGTKPSGIGTILFVLEHSDVGILYDHPKQKSERSSEISKWHMFEVDF